MSETRVIPRTTAARQPVAATASGPSHRHGGMVTHSTLSRSAHADQLAAEVRDARCCQDLARCARCQAKFNEVRAARRDALIHLVASARARRAMV